MIGNFSSILDAVSPVAHREEEISLSSPQPHLEISSEKSNHDDLLDSNVSHTSINESFIVDQSDFQNQYENMAMKKESFTVVEIIDGEFSILKLKKWNHNESGLQ